MHWVLRRNCSVSPQQLLWVFVLLSAVSLVVAGFFWSQGATLVLPFTVVELVAVGTAFLVYARHATDRERISLREGCLVVEHETAGSTQRCEFARHVVRVDSLVEGDRLIAVHGGGRVVRVGRYLRSDLRPALAREIRIALKVC